MASNVPTSGQWSSTAQVNDAGKKHVLGRLSRAGLTATEQTQHGQTEIRVSRAGSLDCRIQVKAHARGRDGWLMLPQHKQITDVNLFYALVDLTQYPPVTYIVPAAMVAEVLTVQYETWLKAPGIKGQPHNDSAKLKLSPDSGASVPRHSGRWIDQYKERWDLVSRSPRLRQPGRQR